MSKPFLKKYASVFIEDGHHRLMLPSGEVLPGDVKSHIIDNVSGSDEKDFVSEVRITLLANLVSTKEEALEKYKQPEGGRFAPKPKTV